MNRARTQLDRIPIPGPITFAAFLGVCVVLFLSVGTILIVYGHANFGSGFRASDWAALKFTILQAALSALLSVLFAIPVARALARRNFRGRSIFVTLLGAPFILPVIVAILGLLAVFGNAGALNQLIGRFGFQPVSIFGLKGVVLAHVFFNMPLATRFFLQSWSDIPAERFRLASSLSFRPFDVFRHLELPMLLATAPRAFFIVFLLCTTSFAVALTLGGGPKATTIELAIFQAFTFDFDLSRAARLAFLQIGIGVIAGLAAFFFTLPSAFGHGQDRPVAGLLGTSISQQVMDIIAISIAAVFLILPLIMVGWNGAASVFSLPVEVYWSAVRSIIVSLGSVALMLGLALPLAILAARTRFGLIETIGFLLLAASPLVIGTGLFLVLFPIMDPRVLALPVTALVNAGAALPFALRVLGPAVSETEESYGRLSLSLSMTSMGYVRHVILPRLRVPLAFSCGLTGALSMGDLGVITLFSGSDSPTLPLMIYRLMGAYRMEDAAGAGLLLLIVSLTLFWILDRQGRKHA